MYILCLLKLVYIRNKTCVVFVYKLKVSGIIWFCLLKVACLIQFCVHYPHGCQNIWQLHILQVGWKLIPMHWVVVGNSDACVQRSFVDTKIMMNTIWKGVYLWNTFKHNISDTAHLNISYLYLFYKIRYWYLNMRFSYKLDDSSQKFWRIWCWNINVILYKQPRM
jgi:hypothetical protein